MPTGPGLHLPPAAGTGEPPDPRHEVVAQRLLAGSSLAGLDLTGLAFRQETLPPGPLDFRGAVLRGAAFESSDLTGACFAESDLCGAAFRHVNLLHADFARCSGRGALFADVNLAYARFAGSDLRGAVFFDANMADISFKGASLEGCEVEGIRLTLNGSTHVLGLKEALRQLAGEESYPLIAGVSGDAFWLSYLLTTRDLNWGGFAKDVLSRGLSNFGFPCSFLDEVDQAAAWEALTAALARGETVITPLHVSGATVLGSGFGGAEWVYVSGIDRGEVLVHSLLGDAIRFPQRRFRERWCQQHPLEEAPFDRPVIYAMCIVGPRIRTPQRGESIREGLRGGIEILTLPANDRFLFGFDAYAQMEQDLESNIGPEDLAPDEARRFLPWLGLGILHHHGSRWAIRDFLGEVLSWGEFAGADRRAIGEAHDLYAASCLDLERLIRLLPWTFEIADARERAAAIREYHANRGEAGDLIRKAAARERDALERFRAVVEPR